MPEPTHQPFNTLEAISASSSLKNKASNGEFDRYRTMNGVSQVPLDASTAARSVTSRETQNAEIDRIKGQITTNPTDESATGIETRMGSYFITSVMRNYKPLDFPTVSIRASYAAISISFSRVS